MTQATCQEWIYRAGMFTGFPCANTPKWWVTRRDGRVETYCGVHVRRYRRNPAVIVEPMA